MCRRHEVDQVSILEIVIISYICKENNKYNNNNNYLPIKCENITNKVLVCPTLIVSQIIISKIICKDI